MAEEGFIHCSTVSQVIRVATAYYGGEKDMWLVWIAVEKLAPELRYESPSADGEKFPHLYGTLNLDAVTAAAPLERDVDGKFTFPKELRVID